MYPPGSIYKPISAFAFLKSGITTKETIHDPGYYEIGKWRWRSWKRGGHGTVNLKKSLVESANVYYYSMADRIGHKPIVEVAQDFGLGQKTGIDLPGEKSGRIPTKDWKKKKF